MIVGEHNPLLFSLFPHSSKHVASLLDQIALHALRACVLRALTWSPVLPPGWFYMVCKGNNNNEKSLKSLTHQGATNQRFDSITDYHTPYGPRCPVVGLGHVGYKRAGGNMLEATGTWWGTFPPLKKDPAPERLLLAQCLIWKGLVWRSKSQQSINHTIFKHIRQHFMGYLKLKLNIRDPVTHWLKHHGSEIIYKRFPSRSLLTWNDRWVSEFERHPLGFTYI